jgi:NAD(P)H-dependent flavin oxidoreductase YrpB (nitropropane dioxygenase family)
MRMPPSDPRLLLDLVTRRGDDPAVQLKTELCRRLGIDHPVWCAGMGGVAGPELALAVSQAGGLGVVGASAAEPAWIAACGEGLRALTDRPFGFNFIIDGVDTDEDRDFVCAQVSAAATSGARIVVLFWGDPAPYVDVAHAEDVLVAVQIGAVDEAREAVHAGVDVVLAQGIEAGGHVRGTTSVWELLPETVRAVSSVPVVASGGIGDGAGLARALRLGAQGVSFGTRFVATDEARAHPAYKQRVVEATSADTVYCTLFDIGWPDAPHRVIRNRVVEEWEAAGCPLPGGRPHEGTVIGKRTTSSGERLDWPLYAVGSFTPDSDADPELVPLWAGKSCDVINDVKPAGAVVRQLVSDARAAF